MLPSGCVRANLLGQYNRPGVPGYTASGQRHNPFIEQGGPSRVVSDATQTAKVEGDAP
jgi:hypothetical protein